MSATPFTFATARRPLVARPPHPRRSTRRAAARLACLAALLMTVGLLAPPPPAAHASCLASPLDGFWQNVSPPTDWGEMSALRIDADCDDTVECDENGNCSGGTGLVFFVQPFGAESAGLLGRRRAKRVGKTRLIVSFPSTSLWLPLGKQRLLVKWTKIHDVELLTTRVDYANGSRVTQTFGRQG